VISWAAAAFFACICVSAAAAATPGATDAIDVSSHRQVFIDGRFFRNPKGAGLTVHSPVKTGEQNIRPDQPWETGIGAYCSVLKEGGTYHFWYKSNDAICYARSADGIHWEKPDLGIVEYQGSRQNNMVIGFGFLSENGGHGPQVFIDPKAPADQKFRLLTR